MIPRRVEDEIVRQDQRQRTAENQRDVRVFVQKTILSIEEMNADGIKLQVLRLKDAFYGFIHKSIEAYGGDDGNTFMYYDQNASDSAWATVLQFLAENKVAP